MTFSIVNRGYFSGQITGFEILDIRLHGIQQIQVEAFVTKAIKREGKDISNLIRQRTKLPRLIGNRLSSDSRLKEVFTQA